jgi:hypothetical protein
LKTLWFSWNFVRFFGRKLLLQQTDENFEQFGAAPVINFPKINKELVKTGFFDYLDFALQFAPAGPAEKEIRAKLACLGIGAGNKFDFKDLSPEQQEQVGLGR